MKYEVLSINLPATAADIEAKINTPNKTIVSMVVDPVGNQIIVVFTTNAVHERKQDCLVVSSWR